MLRRLTQWQLEQRFECGVVCFEREQRPDEYEQQHWVSLRPPLFIFWPDLKI